MYHQIKDKGVASPVEVLIAIGALSKEDYERWRRGNIDYLERACKINLRKLSLVAREIRAYARKHDLKPSWTDYRRWKAKSTGKKTPNTGKAASNTRLRFSKSRDPSSPLALSKPSFTATSLTPRSRLSYLLSAHIMSGILPLYVLMPLEI